METTAQFWRWHGTIPGQKARKSLLRGTVNPKSHKKRQICISVETGLSVLFFRHVILLFAPITNSRLKRLLFQHPGTSLRVTVAWLVVSFHTLNQNQPISKSLGFVDPILREISIKRIMIFRQWKFPLCLIRNKGLVEKSDRAKFHHGATHRFLSQTKLSLPYLSPSRSSLQCRPFVSVFSSICQPIKLLDPIKYI